MPYNSDIHLTPAQRDHTIIELRKRGHSYRVIGKVVGMSPGGVLRAWRRIQAGGRGTRPRE